LTEGLSLATVEVGDIIIGVSALGRLRPLLVHEVSATKVYARLITSQSTYIFARDGRSLRTGDGAGCTIVSTAPLAPGDRKVALGLDRRMGLARGLNELGLAPSEIDLISRLSAQFRHHLRDSPQT
jgi:hypothetical protein